MAEDRKPTKTYHVTNHAPGPRGFQPMGEQQVMLSPKGGEAEVDLTDGEFEKFAKHPDLRFRPAHEVREERKKAAREAEAPAKTEEPEAEAQRPRKRR